MDAAAQALRRLSLCADPFPWLSTWSRTDGGSQSRRCSSVLRRFYAGFLGLGVDYICRVLRVLPTKAAELRVKFLDLRARARVNGDISRHDCKLLEQVLGTLAWFASAIRPISM